MRFGFELRRFLTREVLGKTLRKPPAKERRGPERSTAYRAWIRTLPCAACGIEGRSEAAHTGAHGLGQKAPDAQAIPLCSDCHTRGPQSYHRLGRAAFECAHGLDCARLVRDLNAEWRRAA
jgi:hypothetical protein